MPTAPKVAVTFRVDGIAHLERQLKRLQEAAGPDDVKAGLRKAAEPVVRSTKARAPDDVIRQGIQVIGIKRDGPGLAVEIGLPGGRHPWFYGLWFERGTGPRYHKSGRFTGSMPARPFMRPGFEASKNQARDAYFAELRRRTLSVADA